ncbi:hypothetical protein PV08_00205 [Exophiala spinifera]|uniref:Uncharacterized protein n=1 Tax=Exophiala spinifera TaxID=91928 RepID=A0A0D2A458_9EURO|nr:uncharacterized protein PV08_00205 [Exophiala spinifera]KIW19632.1 hypothetical protein PV08_00205 [Exophiala spinifera]
MDLSSRPPSAHRRLATPPPPSKALLELQRQGLELAASRSESSLYLDVRQNRSAKSTPSDRDKPLPLEPFEKRRSSSVYSNDTTISNIIRMYNGQQELIDTPTLPRLHQPQAYRDTIAPLLIKRLSISKPPSPNPLETPGGGDSSSTASVKPIPLSPNDGPKSNKTAPTFLEFSRSLRERRKELDSALSASPPDHHHQVAYNTLALPSPYVSSVELSLSVSHTPPLPDAMSGSISDVNDSDLLPPPVEFGDSRLPSPVSDDWDNQPYTRSVSPGDTGIERSQHESPESRLSKSWLDAEFVQSPVSASNRPWERTSLAPKMHSGESNYGDIISDSAGKGPTIIENTQPMRESERNSARSSLQQGVSNLWRALSLSRRGAALEDYHEEEEPPRQRQLAKPATPYQVYGAEIWSKKMTKKQRQQPKMQRTRKADVSTDLGQAYQNGQSQFVGVIEGARRKLTRRASQKRRRKLKQSIVLVGPTRTASTVSFVGDKEESWI